MTAHWFESFAAAIQSDDPYYRRCETCSASGWPPRHTCPSCGGPDMVDTPLSPVATVVTHTEIYVTTPKFSGDAPYTVVIAEFDEGVRLTGQLRGSNSIAAGDSVRLDVESRDDEEWVVTFHPE